MTYPKDPILCESCEFYSFIDSGYGHCMRYPPRWRIVKLLPLKYDTHHTVVAWCDPICGEYKKEEK